MAVDITAIGRFNIGLQKLPASSAIFSGHKLNIDAIDLHVHLRLDSLKHILREVVEQLPAEVIGHIVYLAGFCATHVQMGVCVRVVAAATIGGGQFSNEAGLAEGVERVIHGGEAQPLCRWLDEAKQGLCRGMGLSSPQRFVDGQSLLRAAKLMALEQFSGAVHESSPDMASQSSQIIIDPN